MRKLWRVVFLVAGFLLLLYGLYESYWWFYKWAPARHTLDPQWFLSHSQQEHWQEVQKGIHRGTWLHDNASTVGWYGDKSWAEWIMKHVNPVPT